MKPKKERLRRRVTNQRNRSCVRTPRSRAAGGGTLVATLQGGGVTVPLLFIGVGVIALVSAIWIWSAVVAR